MYIQKIEVNMGKEELCWKCKKWLDKKYGGSVYYPPYQHCHHEPKEKLECWWCKDYKDLIMTFPIEWVIRISRLIGLNKENPKCPICNSEL
jgi:hypothetical protein